MANEEEWEANGYRAIGRWMVEFSRLVGGMRTNMENRLRRPDDVQDVVHVAFAGVPAGLIADSFFGMCHLVGDLDGPEENVANQLQKEVVKQNETRNRIAHGDWIIDRGTQQGTMEAHLLRVHAKAPHRRVESYRAADLDNLSDRLREFRGMVWLFGLLALGGPVFTPDGVKPSRAYRVGDILVAENVPKNGKGGKVAIAGPKASEIFL